MHLIGVIVICMLAAYDMTDLLHYQWQMLGQIPMVLSSLLPQWLPHGWIISILFLAELSRGWTLFRYSNLQTLLLSGYYLHIDFLPSDGI